MSDTGKATLGTAVAHVIGNALHHAIVSAAPHLHAERDRHNRGMLHEIADSAQTDLGPIMAHLLDTGKVHPLLEPIVKRMAGR
jgi:hypothetical protein